MSETIEDFVKEVKGGGKKDDEAPFGDVLLRDF